MKGSIYLVYLYLISLVAGGSDIHFTSNWRLRHTISTKACGPTRHRTHFPILEVHKGRITRSTR